MPDPSGLNSCSSRWPSSIHNYIFYLTVEQAKRRGRTVLQTQHPSTDLGEAMDWKIFSSFCQNTPRPRSFRSHARLTLPDQLHVLSFARRCWRSDHICSPEPKAPGGQWAWLPWHTTSVFMHTHFLPFPFPFVVLQPRRINCYCITFMGEDKKQVPMISIRVQVIHEI